MLQTSVINRIPLLHGVPDVCMLMIIAWALVAKDKSAWFWALVGGLLAGYVSAMPMVVFLISYLSIVGIALFLNRQIWQKSVISMLLLTFVGTLITQSLSYLAITLTHAIIPLGETLNLIVLPSLSLNMLLAIPVLTITQDIASFIFPQELEP